MLGKKKIVYILYNQSIEQFFKYLDMYSEQLFNYKL